MLKPGAYKGKERSTEVYPNINSAAMCESDTSLLGSLWSVAS